MSEGSEDILRAVRSHWATRFANANGDNKNDTDNDDDKNENNSHQAAQTQTAKGDDKDSAYDHRKEKMDVKREKKRQRDWSVELESKVRKSGISDSNGQEPISILDETDISSDSDQEVTFVSRKGKLKMKLGSQDNVVVLSDDDDIDDIEIVSERTVSPPSKKQKVSRAAKYNPRKPQQPEVERKARNYASSLFIESPIKMFRTPVLPQKGAVLLSLLFPNTVYKTYQFSMQIDLDFLMPTIMKNTGSCPEIYLVTKDLFAYDTYHSKPEFRTQLKKIDLNLPKWTLHHSKMMINFHSNGVGTSDKSKLFVEIVVMTCNMTFFEFSYMGSCYWKSPLLPVLGYDKQNKDQLKPQPFRDDLITYLKEYKRAKIDALIEELKHFDFSSVRADFVGCVPGSGHDTTKFGYGKLDQILTKHRLKPNSEDKQPLQVLSQMSSIGGPFKMKPEPSNILTHIIGPLAAGLSYPLAGGLKAVNDQQEKFRPMILFPTRTDIQTAEGGPRLTGSFVFNNVGSKGGKLQYEALSRDFFYKRDIANEKKTHLGTCKDKFINNHTKVYLASTDWTEQTTRAGASQIVFNSLKWAMVGSLNLSKSAWGQPGAKGTWRGGNWELGVVVHPEHYMAQYPDKKVVMKPVWNSDRYEESVGEGGYRLTASAKSEEVVVPVRIPFGFPVVKCDPRKDETFSTLE